MHFAVSLRPCSILSRSESPVFNENSSNQTGQSLFESSIASGRAISSLSLESWEMNAAGLSIRDRS
jgi:hypothetical protein